MQLNLYILFQEVPYFDGFQGYENGLSGDPEMQQLMVRDKWEHPPIAG